MEQSARMAALDKFRQGEAELLVASDVAARGLDIPDVSHVFNFDVPHHADDYVHRIGRTGRAGKSGVAITIVAPADTRSLSAIEKLIGQSIEWSGDKPSPDDVGEGDSRSRKRNSRQRNQPRQDSRRESREDTAHQPRRASRKDSSQKPAPIAQLSEARRSKPAASHDVEPDMSHLPAFLLRPVRAKA
jgi:superfamily II DNA/RNA helicase